MKIIILRIIGVSKYYELRSFCKSIRHLVCNIIIYRKKYQRGSLYMPIINCICIILWYYKQTIINCNKKKSFTRIINNVYPS